jgi:uncharacterized protein YycO
LIATFEKNGRGPHFEEIGMYVKRFGPGESAEACQPGDFILTHRKEVYSFLIALGQKWFVFHGQDKPFAHWSHAALIASTDGAIIEALGKGVVRHTLEEYKDIEYHYVHVDMDDHDRRQAVAFAQACVGQRYGWVTIASIGFWLLTKSRLQIGLNGTEICSGLVARSLERGKYIFQKSPNTIMPGDLAKQFEIYPASH